MGKPSNSGTLLNAVSTTGAGTSVEVSTFRNFLIAITATSITSGGTMEIQAQIIPSGAWVTIDARTITSDGETIVQLINAQIYGLRANLTARTDGTYTVVYSATS